MDEEVPEEVFEEVPEETYETIPEAMSETGTAYDRMYDYITEHNYQRYEIEDKIRKDNE